MIEINLLPWREQKREQAKKQFLIYLCAGLLAAYLLSLFMHFYGLHVVDLQTNRVRQLESEIANVKTTLKELTGLKELRRVLLTKSLIIETLQATRPLTIHLLDEIIHVLPKDTYLTQIERIGDKVMLSGYALPSASISKLLQRITTSRWVQEPELTEIKKTESQGDGKSAFKLNFILKPKNGIALNED